MNTKCLCRLDKHSSKSPNEKAQKQQEAKNYMPPAVPQPLDTRKEKPAGLDPEPIQAELEGVLCKKYRHYSSISVL